MSPHQPLPNGAHQTPDTIESDKTYGFLVRNVIEPLTLIQGHAQLIGRRSARGEAGMDVALQARSVSVINQAVPRIMTSLGGSAKLIAMRAA